jgi:predicted transcriptional regulator of viral defense system
MFMNSSVVKSWFKQNHGVLTAKELSNLGVTYHFINQLLEEEVIERVKRGVYVLNDANEEELGLVFKMVPKGIICLNSAAYIHDYTTSIPLRHHLAIHSKDIYHLPDYPPIKLYYWKKSQYELGVETIIHNGVDIKIYDREKTVCDFLKFRNKMETSVLKEVLRSYLSDQKRDIVKLKQYSKELRISTVLDHYLEVLI